MCSQNTNRRRAIAGAILVLLGVTTACWLLDIGLPLGIMCRSQASERKAAAAHLDLGGCKHVYLDVGSNVGVQIRKLFEPAKYKNSTALPVFDKYFGSDIDNRRWTVCAVGFEPNKAHTERLKTLEAAYNQCGWRTHFFTETAVSDHDGQALLFTDQNTKRLEWGASLVEENRVIKAEAGEVKLVRLNDFILEKVNGRKMAKGQEKGSIVMKMDIEGSEIEVLDDMLANGGLLAMNAIMVEYHERLSDDQARKNSSRRIQQSMIDFRDERTCFDLLAVDDEKYMLSDFPLPQC